MRWGPGLVLVLASVVVLVPNLPWLRAPQEDAGVFLYVASIVLDGGLPYRDVWDHKPPGVYAVTTLGLALGRGSEVGVWFVELLSLVIAALVGYAALTRAFGAVAALVASVAWLAASPRLFLADGSFTIFAEFFGLPLQFGTLYLVASSTSESDAARPAILRYLAIGILGGMAFLLKPTLLALWLALAVVLVAMHARELRALMSRALAMASGAVLPLLVAVAAFVVGGALADLWDQAFAYNVANSRTATMGDRAIAAITGVRLTAPSGFVVLATLGWIGTAIALARSRFAPSGVGLLPAVAMLAAPVEIALASVPGRPYHYYYLSWLPAFAVLTALVAQRIISLLPRRAPLLLGALLIASCAQPVALLLRLSPLTDDGLSRAAARYLAGTTAESESVLLWGSRSEINFLSERRSPTRFVYQYAPLYTVGYATPERVAEFLRELERNPPSVIIDVSGSSFATPALDLTAIRRWESPEPRYQPPSELERVAAYILANYRPVGMVPDTGWPAFRRRVSSLPLTAAEGDLMAR